MVVILHARVCASGGCGPRAFVYLSGDCGPRACVRPRDGYVSRTCWCVRLMDDSA